MVVSVEGKIEDSGQGRGSRDRNELLGDSRRRVCSALSSRRAYWFTERSLL